MIKHPKKQLTLSQTLKRQLFIFLIPLVFLLILMLFFVGFYIEKYNRISNNITIISKFNLDFKHNMDLKMYHYCVGSSSELPIQDLDEAVSIIKALSKTTIRKESKKALEHLLSYCDNLELRIYQISQTKEYDSRQTQLENNIYILTKLIEEEIQNYIYYEAGYIAMVEKQVSKNIWLVFLSVTIIFLVTILILLKRVFRFSEGISRPIREICENVQAVSNGHFDIPIVETKDYEIQVLSSGIQNMSHQIKLLLKNVKEEQEAKHIMEFQLLQAQINPHFLYNTLDTIVWLVEAKQREKAIEVVSSLSIFFRISLSKGKDIITIKEEINHIRSYLKIQRARYYDILSYEIHIAEEIEDLYLPKLTLQPLVENALYHGIKNKRGKGMILVEGYSTQDCVLLSVTDNGTGITKERLCEIEDKIEKKEKIGFGLSAVQERIRLYYGKEYGINIQSEEGKGTKVEICIPKKTERKNQTKIIKNFT